jgi:AAA+ ATPase superfamily predicted ATPase
MSRFINRTNELKFLEKKYKSKEAEFIIIYGRRRIGKTELLLKFCENKESMYFIGRLESKEETIKRFNNLLIERFGNTKLLSSPLSNWDAIFDYIAENVDKRLILVIDEFPFLVDRSPEIISIIQDKWDSKLKNTEIMLILSGSSISMMEKYALDYKSPLYGRRTGQWKVDKMNVIHLKEFFPNYSIEDLIRIYSYLDTIPGYLTKFLYGHSLTKNLEEKIFSKGEFLYEEIEILLREELRDPSNYMSIISAIAGGLTAFNEIYNKTGLDKSLLSKYISVLENLGILEKIIPVTESYKSKLKARGALYSLKDNFFDFWFKFVYLNKQELEKGNANIVLANIKQDIEQYVSKKFENFAKEVVSLGVLGSFSKIGRWWDKKREIDIVAINEDKKEILFGECKWSNNVNALSIISGLSEKTKYVYWHNQDRKESFAVFAKSFSKKISKFEGKKVQCFDLKNIEKSLEK